MASSTTTITKISQLACFSSVNRQRQHRRHCVIPFPSCRSKLSISMTLEKPGAESTGPEIKRVSAYGDDETILHSNGTTKLHSSSIDSTAQEPESNPPKNAAKIHDFCLGIPFGGIIFGVGLVGFILSKNPTALLFGGGILALSTLSLKIWSQGKSSLPFILGQIVLAAALLWKNIQTYSLTKKVFPTGFSAFLSAAMLCFYSYVIVSGGNPPPKKKKKANVGVSS